MANTILNFHFDYWNTSLIKVAVILTFSESHSNSKANVTTNYMYNAARICFRFLCFTCNVKAADRRAANIHLYIITVEQFFSFTLSLLRCLLRYCWVPWSYFDYQLHVCCIAARIYFRFFCLLVQSADQSEIKAANKSLIPMSFHKKNHINQITSNLMSLSW